ncbi:dynamin family protein [Actinomycetospora cinnamomea]|uniref:Dynamin family protein n=1 Tax=Actinomycetospora cinnamomea TaxID=663609 RepID=A0A2U1F657_9PSEU|nr:dynamin family protein [Actinomycetospora cinnamomea]PVZ07659.1 dynamin family protein [Actinomycetospora cinnamomea]
MTIKAATAYEREDLVARLRTARKLLTDAAVRIPVVGEFKQGKSSLVNALVEADVCPVDDDIATAVPTEVRHAPGLTASAHFEALPGSKGAGWTETITPDEVAAYASESGNPGNTRRLVSVSIGIDRALLAGGLVLVDTPGVGGLGGAHQSAVADLPRAHACLFVSDASRELTDAEVRFLHAVVELCPTVVMVLTKTDLTPRWPRILERNQAHLHRAGVRIEIHGFSAELCRIASDEGDEELRAESGAPELLARLDRVREEAAHLAVRSVMIQVGSVLGQLESAARARRDALVHPARQEALVAELAAAKERAEALRDRGAKWQAVLNDGFADISSDTEFDLRARARAVQKEADEAIEAGDPANNWEEFSDWLRRRLAAEAMENYALFVRRTKDVAIAVEQHLDLAEARITARSVSAPADVMARLALDVAFAPSGLRQAVKLPLLQKVFGGVVMLTMISNMAGLGLPMAAGLVLGGVLGVAGIREERKKALEKRRTDAKAGVRKYVDEFINQVGKDSRDAIRHVQRELRGAWTERVSELQRAATAAMTAAQAAVAAGKTDTGARERIEKDLESLRLVRARVDDLSEHLRRTAPPPVAARAS